MRKINKIDEFYEDKEVLEALEHNSSNNRELFSVEVNESASHTSITIHLHVIDSLGIAQQRRIYYKLRELLINVRPDISPKLIKELKKDLEEQKEVIREDLDLGGKKKDD